MKTDASIYLVKEVRRDVELGSHTSISSKYIHLFQVDTWPYWFHNIFFTDGSKHI